MSELDREKLAQLIRDLDGLVPREGASVKLENDPGEGFISGNELGFLRLGIEMLKAGYNREGDVESAGEDHSQVGSADIGYLFESSEIEAAEPLAEQAGAGLNSARDIIIGISVVLVMVIGVAVAYMTGLLSQFLD